MIPQGMEPRPALTTQSDALADFTEAELKEMITSGVTLDDAIREIERLRDDALTPAE